MKVLVAADGADLSANVSKRFGHAAQFLLVDSESWTCTPVDGVGAQSPDHGVGRLVALGVDRVITGNIGPHAYDELHARNMKVYICRHTTVQDAVRSVTKATCQPTDGPTVKRSLHERSKVGS